MVDFLAGSGWHFTVFYDAGDFDYFDSILSVDGTRLNFDWIADNSVDLFNWYPEDDTLWEHAPLNLRARDGDY